MQMGVCSSIKHDLLAKRYNQIEGIDYFDIFSPIGKSITGQVCKLKKSLYGLKEASRQWNVELIGKLQRYGFIQSPHEHSLFMKSTSSCFLALVVYMDDILLTEDSETELVAIKYQLNQHFTINDLGYAKYFLGLELAESDHSILVTQYKFLHDIFHDAQMLDSKVLLSSLEIPRSRPQFHDPPWKLNTAAWGLLFVSSFSCLTSSVISIFPFKILFHSGVITKKPSTSLPTPHEHTKHLDIESHLVRDQIRCGFIMLSHLLGHNQFADLFMKSPLAGDFARLFVKLSLVFHAPS
ncbi:UNVERIFIED_CONTAM: hypothetical protein Sradi_6467900 [Sesamum radiatum]|uniref:Reverse transcriptase Ty1/copia-type domain-containing protein n=1 Tax=Sesamum radiatum TaxID=300843 RepID=A0AAW2K5M4_SESRA